MDLQEFDLAEKAENGFPVQLRHPGKPTVLLDGTIDVVGIDSATYKAAAKKMNEALVGITGDTEKRKAAEVRLLADCTRGWKSIFKGEEPIEFSYQAAIDLYTRFEWIFDQVNRAIADRGRFFTT